MEGKQRTLRSQLIAARAVKAKYILKSVMYKCKVKWFKLKSAAKRHNRMVKACEIKVAKALERIGQLKIDIEAARVEKLLESNKSGIIRMFRAVLVGDQLDKFDERIDNQPEYAVVDALDHLAKTANYQWNGCDPWTVPEEAILLVIPALARGPHRDLSKACEIVRERLAELGISRANRKFPGWRTSEDGSWDAKRSAFIRDIVPVLPAFKEAIDKCTGCETCRAARRTIENVLQHVRSRRSMRRNVLLLLLC